MQIPYRYNIYQQFNALTIDYDIIIDLINHNKVMLAFRKHLEKVLSQKKLKIVALFLK